MEDISWKLIGKYFKDNPYNLVSHHLDSYDAFFEKHIYQIFHENNPVRFIEPIEEGDTTEVENRNECLLYLGGKDGSKIYIGKPVIYDDNNSHYMYPNEARLRNMTYGTTIHYDVHVDMIYYEGDVRKEHSLTLEQIYLGRFPIMVQSKLCVLNNLPREVRFNMGECRNDYGGYFISNSNEKAIISQEKFADNMLYVKKNTKDSVPDDQSEGEMYSYSAEIRSVSEDASKPVRKTAIMIVAPSSKLSNNQVVVQIPNVRKPIPLFIVMRALGVVSDKKIIEYCLLDLEKNEYLIDVFVPSVHDALSVFNQKTAIEFIATFTKRRTVSGVLDILMNFLLPHVGTTNLLDKAYFIGYMTNRMLRVVKKIDKPTDRDHFRFKRIELSGSLMYDLFREYFLIQHKSIAQKIDKEFYYHRGEYKTNFINLIENNYNDYFKERVVESGFKKAFKGNWGSQAHTKKIGVVQDLNRLSWNSFISQLRKMNLPLDASAKVVGPRLLHSSQWGYIDPVDTPDGGNIGLHKHMAISTIVTSGTSSEPIIIWLRAKTTLKLLQECNSRELYYLTKVFVNGKWVGSMDKPLESLRMIKTFRRNGVLPPFLSVTFLYEANELHIYTDSGRLTRPIYYIENGKPSFHREEIKERILKDDFTWEEIVSGFTKKSSESLYSIKGNKIHSIYSLYPQFKQGDELIDSEFEKNQAVVDYIDPFEEESSLIASKLEELKKSNYYTHLEIDPSLLFGVMGNQVIYPEDNPFPRNVFSCGQSKQAVSLYSSNYQMRMDKMGVVLNYGQIPLIKSKYLEYINNEEMPYGVNTIVAIMSYTGYNVEDAILINEGSVKRGLFNTTYFTTYEAREESGNISGSSVSSTFAEINGVHNIRGLKPGHDYSELDKHGLVKEETPITDKTVIIGKTTYDTLDNDYVADSSVFTKKGQLGVVDKSFITEGEEGTRIAKIRVREQRIPAIGDKMASRAGQKGTIGLIIPEENMPFTSDGTRPDIIINPHAIPSRMTIGQLMESLFGKACAAYGGYGEGTAFATKGANTKVYGNMLVNAGFHSSGNQVLYNGMSGEQLYSDIYMGPTYYMRLKHMVKDKINHRGRGRMDALTRQTVQGRANDGGLRIGEMERDGILAHGASHFLTESFMTRGDEYHMAICNKTGTIAVYNKDLNLFLSPFVDGPLRFNTNVEGTMNIENLSRFGRSFSIVRIPYSLKLLIQELQTMNIQMRIITEDNVDQLMNISYSNNVNKLLKDDGELSSVLNEYRRDINKKLQQSEPSVKQYTAKQKDSTIPSYIETEKELEPEEEISMETSSSFDSYHPDMNSSSVNEQSQENNDVYGNLQYPSSSSSRHTPLMAPPINNMSSLSSDGSSFVTPPMLPPPSRQGPQSSMESSGNSSFTHFTPPMPPPPSGQGQGINIQNEDLRNQYDSLNDIEKMKLMEMVAEKQSNSGKDTETPVAVKTPISILDVEEEKEDTNEDNNDESNGGEDSTSNSEGKKTVSITL